METKPKGQILIIGNDMTLQKALLDEFGREGLVILVANDGEEGLIMALKQHPGVILLDINMPKMNGVKMLETLRQDIWGKTVPVLILTNDENPEHMRKALQNNAVDYLLKFDWKIEDVVEKVKETLRTG